MTESVPCIDCGKVFERIRRSGRYCSECRARIKRENDKDRRSAAREEQAGLRQLAESMREYLTEDMYATVTEYIDSLGVPLATPVTTDRMPPGTLSGFGPNEGMTTEWKDLQLDLDKRRLQIIMHDWFKDNPHWAVGVND